MYRNFNASKRAHTLACLMVTTSLYPLAAHAQEAGEAIALPTVEVEATKESEGPGSSQGGAGLGGRFTGYTVDLGTPAQATKDNTPILQTPTNI